MTTLHLKKKMTGFENWFEEFESSLKSLMKEAYDAGFKAGYNKEPSFKPNVKNYQPIGPFKIFIREQSDSYWDSDSYSSLEDAMAARNKIKSGPLGSSFMVMIYDNKGFKITER